MSHAICNGEPGKGLEKGDGQDQGYTWRISNRILMHERGCHRGQKEESQVLPAAAWQSGHEGMNQSGDSVERWKLKGQRGGGNAGAISSAGWREARKTGILDPAVGGDRETTARWGTDGREAKRRAPAWAEAKVQGTTTTGLEIRLLHPLF